MKHKVESRLLGEISITSNEQMTPPIWQIAKESQKNIYFCFIDYAKEFDCVDHNKLWKILNEMGKTQHITCLLRNVRADKKQQLELDMEQQTVSKSGKSTSRLFIVTLLI